MNTTTYLLIFIGIISATNSLFRLIDIVERN